MTQLLSEIDLLLLGSELGLIYMGHALVRHRLVSKVLTVKC